MSAEHRLRSARVNLPIWSCGDHLDVYVYQAAQTAGLICMSLPVKNIRNKNPAYSMLVFSGLLDALDENLSHIEPFNAELLDRSSMDAIL
jgi:hypothetical protein